MIPADLAREHLARGRPLVLLAEGHSMWPLIRHGERVRVEPLSRAPVIGDVVLFALGSRLVLHRVVALGSLVVTKGDANPYRDPPIAPAAILGRLPSDHRALNGALAALSRLGARPLAAVLQRTRLALARLSL